jgi:hypothetical protein
MITMCLKVLIAPATINGGVMERVERVRGYMYVYIVTGDGDGDGDATVWYRGILVFICKR